MSFLYFLICFFLKKTNISKLIKKLLKYSSKSTVISCFNYQLGAWKWAISCQISFYNKTVHFVVLRKRNSKFLK